MTAAYSQKFPNGTFEEVSCVADEMMKLAEKCCQDDANPDCYDKGTVVPALFRSLTRSCRVILGSFLTFLKIIDAPRGREHLQGAQHPFLVLTNHKNLEYQDNDKDIHTTATEISEKSCGKNSPFPKHPDIEQCCSVQGHERKLCLATLRYSTDKLPSLLEPTPEEICTQYTQDPDAFALRHVFYVTSVITNPLYSRYVYEFARRHRSIPAGFVFNTTQNHVRMAKNCCSPTASNPCFFKERYQQRSSTIFLRFLSNVCNNQVNLKSHQTGLTAFFGSLLRVPFEEALAIAKHFQSGLAKCCLQLQPQCVIEEFTSFQKVLCKESILGTMSKEFQGCCSKAPLDTLTCVDNLKRESLKSLNMTQVPMVELCEKDRPDNTDRYLFQIGVKHASVSLPVLTIIQDQIKSTVAACCSAPDNTATCLKEKESKLEKTAALLAKTDAFCSQYFKLELPAFKTMVQREVQGEGAESRAQAWVELATACCTQHSPAQQCQKLVSQTPLALTQQ
ncbi:hypothetical protein NFI96_013065 [Prochilodus magdalenae]|nr:hypothetical protein NFI96_013065 [Prochilodus magdalenae]